MKKYNLIKWFYYGSSMLISIVLMIALGTNGSHTPPYGFVFALLFSAICLIWLITDWVLGIIYTKKSFNLNIHILGLLLYFIILFSPFLIHYIKLL